jgi:SNF2 family DNA or RNA helicase
LLVDGAQVIVRMAQPEGDRGVQVAVEGPDGVRLIDTSWSELAAARAPAEDGRGASLQAITAPWALWMRWITPRIRSAVLATAPLQPYAHQDEAVSGHMLNQPRLRLLLGDEPGTGKTIMTGMYVADARRRGLVTGRALVVVPAHLVTKWLLDLERYFGIRAQQVTAEIGRSPLPLREDVDTWIVSLDLYT